MPTRRREGARSSMPISRPGFVLVAVVSAVASVVATRIHPGCSRSRRLLPACERSLRREGHRLAEERRARGRRLGDDAAAADHPPARRMQAHYLERARRVVDDEVGLLSLLEAVLVLDPQRA